MAVLEAAWANLTESEEMVMEVVMVHVIVAVWVEAAIEAAAAWAAAAKKAVAAVAVVEAARVTLLEAEGTAIEVEMEGAMVAA